MQHLHTHSVEQPAHLIKELLRADAFEHPVSQIELRETHLSWIVLTGAFAYKIKKPVKFDFIDAATLEQRRRLCMEELRLNRRLAPQLYIEVVPITRKDGHAIVGGDGIALEYAVRMQQFAAAEELPALLAHDAVSLEEITTLAELLARFHRDADIAPARSTAEETQRLYSTVIGNLAQLLAHLDTPEPTPRLRALTDWTHQNAVALEPIFAMREQLGFVRECHGDLHTANIVRWNGQLVPFDCIEFDPDLRWIDVIADLSFLVMDLIAHERRDLAFALLSRYLEITGDYHGARLLPFCAVYRALVRAKVDALTAEQVPSRAIEFRERLRRRVRAAMDWMKPSEPVLVLMHGASGSGKSWMSTRLVPELHAVRIRSDLERKRLAGIAASEPAAAPVRQGIYSPEFSHRTYSRLLDCAEHCLSAGLNVIVDAAFLEPRDRELFRQLANRSGVPCFIVSCQADPITLAARVLERFAQRKDASDADLSVLDTQLREIAPFETTEQGCVITVNTEETAAVKRVSDTIKQRIAS